MKVDLFKCFSLSFSAGVLFATLLFVAEKILDKNKKLINNDTSNVYIQDSRERLDKDMFCRTLKDFCTNKGRENNVNE